MHHTYLHTIYLIVDHEDFENLGMSWEGGAEEALRVTDEMFMPSFGSTGRTSPCDEELQIINDHSSIARVQTDTITPELIWAFVNLVRTGNSNGFEGAASSFEVLNYDDLRALAAQEEELK